MAEEMTMTMQQLTSMVRDKLKNYLLMEKELGFSDGTAFLFGEGVAIAVRKHWDGIRYVGKEIALTFGGQGGIRKENRAYKLESIHNAADRAIGIVEKVKRAREAEEKARTQNEAIRQVQETELSEVDMHHAICAKRYHDGSYKVDIGTFLSLTKLKQLNELMHTLIPVMKEIKDEDNT